MSEYYGYLQRNRGVVTRCGSKGSGINAHIRSWNNDVYAHLFRGKEGDQLTLEIPVGLPFMINGQKFIINDQMKAEEVV